MGENENLNFAFSRRTYNILKKLESSKISVLIVGEDNIDYGIGKSAIIYQYAKIRAEEEKREFVVWHELTEKEKHEILKNPERYYVLVDIKGSLIRPEKLELPILKRNGDGEVVWEYPSFLKLFSNEKSAGLLFLDEINTVEEDLQTMFYELLYQRKIGELPIKGKVFIVACGNLPSTSLIAKAITPQIINRCAFLRPSHLGLGTLESWIQWAKTNDIDERVIAFVLWKKYIVNYAETDFEQSTTPRSLELLSKAIKNENDIETIRIFAEAFLNKRDAVDFVTFIQNYSILTNFDKFLEDPTKIDKLSEMQKIIMAIETQKRLSESLQKGDNDYGKKLMRILERFILLERTEYVAMVFRLTKLEFDQKDPSLITKLYRLVLEYPKIAETIRNIVKLEESLEK